MAKKMLGHAVHSEKYNKYGNPGDQTCREVRYDDWYDEGWNVVLRPKSSAVAEKIAKAMEQIVENENVGYCQSDRTTLYVEAKKRNWQIHLITTKCECDCSSAVAVCVNAAGIKVSKDMYTGNMVKVLEATGAFEKKLTAKKYLKESSYLKRGDILVHEGSHTAVVLTDGDKVKSDYDDVSYYVSVTAFWLNVREKSNSKSKIVKALKKGTKLHITKKKGDWGYSEEYNGWLNTFYTKKDTDQTVVNPYIAVTTTTVNYRTEPNSSSNKNIITKFNKGQYLLITTERSDGWVYAKTIVDGIVKSGWIFTNYIDEVSYNALRRRRVTDVTGLNIRNSSNTNASCLKTIPFNKEFYVIEDSPTWGVVVYKDVLGYSHLSNNYSEKTFYF